MLWFLDALLLSGSGHASRIEDPIPSLGALHIDVYLSFKSYLNFGATNHTKFVRFVLKAWLNTEPFGIGLFVSSDTYKGKTAYIRISPNLA